MNIKKLLTLVCRVLSMGCGIFLAILGIIRFNEEANGPYYHILSGVFCLYGSMIILSSIPIFFMLKYFAILCHNFGMSGFMIFSAVLIFDWNNNSEFACSMCLYAGAAINILIGFLL